MSHIFEVIYTSSQELLQEGERDLGVLAATEGTPPKFLEGISLHRSFPTSELTAESKGGEVAHKFLFRKIDGFLHLVQVNYAGADHTGRDKPYSHEVIFDQESTQKCIAPVKLAADYQNRLQWCNRLTDPKWLQPKQLPHVEKTSSEECLKTAVTLLGKDRLVAILDVLTLRKHDEFITVILPIDDWSDSIYRIVDVVLQCLPPHLQHGVMAQPGDVGSVPDDVKLVIAPTDSHFSRQVKSSSRPVIDLSSKNHRSINLQEPSPDGYGHQFVVEERLVLRSLWEFFDLEGVEGVKDSKHILRQEEVKNLDFKQRLEACSTSLVDVSNKKVQKHLGSEFASLLQNNIPSDCLPVCLKAIQATFREPEAAVQKLLSHCKEDLIKHNGPLNPVVRDALLKWLFSNSDAAQVPKSILKAHFETVPHPLREKVARQIAPTNSPDWITISWGHEKTGSESYVKRAANLLISRVQPDAEAVSSPAVRRLVQKALNTEKYWEDSLRRRVVTNRNVYEFDRYLMSFNITSSSQKPIWWPRGQSRVNSSGLTGSTFDRSVVTTRSSSGVSGVKEAILSVIPDSTLARFGLYGILVLAISSAVGLGISLAFQTQDDVANDQSKNSSMSNTRFELVKLQDDVKQKRKTLDPILTIEDYNAAWQFLIDETKQNNKLVGVVIATGISQPPKYTCPSLSEIEDLINSKSIVGFTLSDGKLNPVDGRHATWGLKKKPPMNESNQQESTPEAKGA